MSKNTNHQKRLLLPKNYEGKFLVEPSDELWLDKKDNALRTPYGRRIIICLHCKSEIKLYYDIRRVSHLVEDLRGKLCPKCKGGSLSY